MTADVCLVDTNVLIEATNDRRRSHREARALVESTTPLVISAQVIREYLAVATRPPAANGLGLSMADALANVQEFRRGIRLLPEERPVLSTFLALLERASCAGTRVHDAHLVATAVAHRVSTIVSLNAGGLSGFTTTVSVITPRQALGDQGPATWRERPRSRRRTV